MDMDQLVNDLQLIIDDDEDIISKFRNYIAIEIKNKNPHNKFKKIISLLMEIPEVNEVSYTIQSPNTLGIKFNERKMMGIYIPNIIDCMSNLPEEARCWLALLGVENV